MIKQLFARLLPRSKNNTNNNEPLAPTEQNIEPVAPTNPGSVEASTVPQEPSVYSAPTENQVPDSSNLEPQTNFNPAPETPVEPVAFPVAPEVNTPDPTQPLVITNPVAPPGDGTDPVSPPPVEPNQNQTPPIS